MTDRLLQWVGRARTGILLFAMAGCAQLPLAGSIAVPPIPQSQTRVWFYRDANVYESLQRPYIRMNGGVVGISEPGGTFYRDLPSGNYHVSVDSYFPQVNSTRDVYLFPGQQVYFKVLPEQQMCGGGGGGGDGGGGGECMRANFYVWTIPPEVAQTAVARSQFYPDGG
jgi:hypothetical protein